MISFFKNVGLYQFFFKKIRFLRAFSSFSTKNSSTFSNFSKNSKFIGGEVVRPDWRPVTRFEGQGIDKDHRVTDFRYTRD